MHIRAADGSDALTWVKCGAYVSRLPPIHRSASTGGPMSVVASSVVASCWSRCTARDRQAIQVDALDDEFVLDLIRETRGAGAGGRPAQDAATRSLWAERHAVVDECSRPLTGRVASDRAGELRDVEQTDRRRGHADGGGAASVPAFAAALGITTAVGAPAALRRAGPEPTGCPRSTAAMESLQVAPWRARQDRADDPPPLAGGRGATSTPSSRRWPTRVGWCGSTGWSPRPSRGSTPRRAGRGRGRGQGGVGRQARPLHRASLGRHVPVGDHRRHPDPDLFADLLAAKARAASSTPTGLPRSSRRWSTARSRPLRHRRRRRARLRPPRPTCTSTLPTTNLPDGLGASSARWRSSGR